MGQHFAFEPFDEQRLLMLHGSAAPPNREWQDYISFLRNKEVTRMGLLVFTAGGAPDAAQRRALNDVLAGRHFARAIVHDSAVVRGVIAAVGWFAPGVQPFRPNEWRLAARHALFEPAELMALRARLSTLHGQLAAPIPWLEATLAE